MLITPSQSPARELIRSRAGEWLSNGAPPIIATAWEHLAWNVVSSPTAPDPDTARALVNLLGWSQAEGSGLYTYAPFPEYGAQAASYGNDPSNFFPPQPPLPPMNLYPAGLWPGTTQAAPWGNEQCACSGAWLAWLTNLDPPISLADETYGIHGQCGFWCYLSSAMLSLGPLWPGGYYAAYESDTLAVRSRYRLPIAATGFRAFCEIWAFDVGGSPGWNSWDPSAGGVATSYQPRFVTWQNGLDILPGRWNEVPVPTDDSSPNGTVADGFVGLAQFDFWGLTPAEWSAGTYTHIPITGGGD
jgi:hypothetical protein